MKQKQLARELARSGQMTMAAAEDRIDELVHEILTKLRAGEFVSMEQLERHCLGRLKARPAGGK